MYVLYATSTGEVQWLHPTIWPDKAKLAMPVDMAAVKQQCSTGAFDAQQLDSAPAPWKDKKKVHEGD